MPPVTNFGPVSALRKYPPFSHTPGSRDSVPSQGSGSKEALSRTGIISNFSVAAISLGMRTSNGERESWVGKRGPEKGSPMKRKNWGVN